MLTHLIQLCDVPQTVFGSHHHHDGTQFRRCDCNIRKSIRILLGYLRRGEGNYLAGKIRATGPSAVFRAAQFLASSIYSMLGTRGCSIRHRDPRDPFRHIRDIQTWVSFVLLKLLLDIFGAYRGFQGAVRTVCHPFGKSPTKRKGRLHPLLGSKPLHSRSQGTGLWRRELSFCH